MAHNQNQKNSRRTSGSQNRRPNPSQPARRGAPSRRSHEMDRYHHVNREVYSSSRRGDSRKPPKKKASRAKKAIVIAVCVVLALVLAAAGFVVFMLGRVNREDVDTSSYVQLPADAPNWDVLDLEGTTNILLIGADKNEDGSNGRSDSMMLVSLDHKNKSMKMVSFLRDLYVEIPDHGKDKLNVAYMLGGAGRVMQTLENNFRIRIDRYILTDFEDFADMIDLMGGIDLEMTQAEADYMNEIKGCDLKEGRNHLRGTLALYYARMRYLDSDFGRTGRQRQVILAMVEKMKRLNLLQSVSFLYQFLPHFTTNLTQTELLGLAGKALDIADYQSNTLYLPYKGMYRDERNQAGEVLVPDLEQNARKLREFLYPDATSSEA